MKQLFIIISILLLASVSLSAQVVKGAGLWYFTNTPNVTPSTASGTEVAYSINQKSLYKWNRTTSAWIAVVQDSSATNEIQDLLFSGDTLYLSDSDSTVFLGQFRNTLWEITNLSDTTGITSPIEADVAYVTSGDTIAFRGATAWLPFTGGGGGGGTFNSFNIAGDTGSSIITDGQTVTVAGGYGANTANVSGTVTVEVDTAQIATQYDISVVADSAAVKPSGTGTNLRIPLWTGTNSLGSSTLLQSTTGQTLDANLAFQITGGTTASRPTGAAGMWYWNTTNGWPDIHNGTAWFNPLRSATATGLGTATKFTYFDANGLAESTTNAAWDNINSRAIFGATTPQTNGTLTLSGSNLVLTGATTTGLVRATSDGADNQYTFVTGGGGTSNSEARGGNFTVYGNEVSNFEGAMIFQAGLIGVNNTRSGSIWFNTSNAYQAVFARTTGNFGVGTTIFSGSTLPAVKGHFVENNSITADRSPVLRIDARSTGTPAVGFGPTMQFVGEEANGDLNIITDVSALYTSHTSGSETADFVVRTLRSGTLTEALRSLGNGTLQIGTLSGTATQLMGATSGNIATAVTLGAGLSFSSGTLNGAFLPLTLTGATEVNTAGQNLYFRDAAGYPFTFMNSNYWIAASDVNTFVDVGSTSGTVTTNAATRIFSASAGTHEIQAASEMRIDADSLVLDGVYPVGTSSDSVLVRDGATGRVNLRAQTDILPTLFTGGANPIQDQTFPYIAEGEFWGVLRETGDGDSTYMGVIDKTIFPENPAVNGQIGQGIYGSSAVGEHAGIEIGTDGASAVAAMYAIDSDSSYATISLQAYTTLFLNYNFTADSSGGANIDYTGLQVNGALTISDTENGDGAYIAAISAGGQITRTGIAGNLEFTDGALTTGNNLYEVADTITRTLGTGQQVYSNGYAAYSGSNMTYASGRVTNASGSERKYKIRYYFTALTASGPDPVTVKVQIWDGATYTEHRAGRLVMTLPASVTTAGSKETIITLPDGDGVNISFDSANGLDVSNFGYVIEQI